MQLEKLFDHITKVRQYASSPVIVIAVTVTFQFKISKKSALMKLE